MRAYKVFNENWKCRGFQYKIGETYSMAEKPVLCECGFHACVKVADCFNYYLFNTNNKIAEVELLGDVVGDENKYCCNKIKILKELTWNEMLLLANIGKGNTGRYNAGNYNAGNYNAGNYNTGNYNTGAKNTGAKNAGNYNAGFCNVGDYNTGAWNTGYFCTVIHDDILIFNKPCERSKWENAQKPNFINIILTEWINFSDMTDEEKAKYPNASFCDGYLKSYEYKDAWANSFKTASKRDIALLKALPNFDADVFFEISGIRIN